MKFLKLSVLAGIAAMLVMGLTGSAFAYHDGGVAHCEGCHTMHNSFTGNKMSVAGTVLVGNAYLLKGSDQSSTCLNCHGKTATSSTTPSGYTIATLNANGTSQLPVQRTPGGDFGWLLVNATQASGKHSGNSIGQRHGHNVIAADFAGFIQDPNQTVAPGGTYPAASLSCISCHDPHGKFRTDTVNGYAVNTITLPIINSGSYPFDGVKYVAPTAGTDAVGAYRLLAGVGYQPKSLSGSFGFVNNSPIAVAPSSYNQSEATTEVRVAYGKGMGEWCANCHTAMLDNGYATGATNHRHPAGNSALLTLDGAGIATNYNKYVKTGDLSGTSATSFTNLVPYEEQVMDRTVIGVEAVNDGSQTGGPTTGNENVMCLSCHRAHASGFNSMLRFFENDTMMVEGGTYVDYYTTYTSGAYMQAALYDRPHTVFADDQRVLCNKCHAKD